MLITLSQASAEDAFQEHVMPLLKSYCSKCHNQKTSEGEFDLTRYTSAINSGVQPNLFLRFQNTDLDEIKRNAELMTMALQSHVSGPHSDDALTRCQTESGCKVKVVEQEIVQGDGKADEERATEEVRLNRRAAELAFRFGAMLLSTVSITDS